MPYKGAQAAACYAQLRRFLRAGVKPTWDCFHTGPPKKKRTRHHYSAAMKKLHAKLRKPGKLTSIKLKFKGRQKGSGVVRTSMSGAHYVVFRGHKVYV